VVVGTPVYRRIVQDIKQQIHAGVLRGGQRLPSISQLRQRYGVSAQPVKSALIVLREQGLTRGQPGRGVFVVDHPPIRKCG
jgi:DNA-binding GntR family transcriptional regulator